MTDSKQQTSEEIESSSTSHPSNAQSSSATDHKPEHADRVRNKDKAPGQSKKTDVSTDDLSESSDDATGKSTHDSNYSVAPKNAPRRPKNTDDGSGDEVRVEGVNLEEYDDAPPAHGEKKAKNPLDAEDSADHKPSSEASPDADQQQGPHRSSQDPHRHPQGRHNHSSQRRGQKKKDFKKNAGSNPPNRPTGNKPKPNKPNNRNAQKPAKQPKKFQKQTIVLEDGGEAEMYGLDLGELPEWTDLQDLEELEAMAGEYAPAEEALDFNALYALTLNELREHVHQQEIAFSHTPNRNQMLRALLQHTIEKQCLVAVQGILEVLDDGNGLLLYAEDNYRIKEFSTFIPKVLLQKFGLQRGHHLSILAHPPRDSESAPFGLQLRAVNGQEPSSISNFTPFTELIPYYPTERFLMEREDAPKEDTISMRVVDLLTPIGKGQRGLIVAPPRTGKTMLMQGMANSIATNAPDTKLIILLVDERPEEVTDFKRHCAGEVIASTFDESAESHVHASEIVIDKARRMVEAGEDVVILLDSITRLARAYNTLMPGSGKVLSGGVEASAMQKPKRFFGSARNIEEGGSLTILGTALVETGSRMDEVVFEEFKGTGNMELHLERALVDKRIFPALSFERCGTRKEELLYHPDEMQKIYGLRRAMKGIPSTEAMEMLIQRVKKTQTNAEFLMTLNR